MAPEWYDADGTVAQPSVNYWREAFLVIVTIVLILLLGFRTLHLWRPYISMAWDAKVLVTDHLKETAHDASSIDIIRIEIIDQAGYLLIEAFYWETDSEGHSFKRKERFEYSKDRRSVSRKD